MKDFDKLGLNQSLLKILEEIGFKEPTEIQYKVIPLALAGKDVIGKSATGSGKTLAFGAPIIEKIRKGYGLNTLILTPTRELTEQVSKSLSLFSRYKDLKVVSVYGGVSISLQIKNLRDADIAVGTPGRLLDHISRGTINLSRIKILVLDEADRMLDMGFFKDVTKIIGHCPKNRQTLLFSATISNEIIEISKRYMNHPVEVSAESYIDPSKLKQVFYDVSSKKKFSLLVHLLKEERSKLVMVFCNTKRNTRFLGDNLQRQGFDALALHGDLNQNQRNRILEHFHKSEKFILVCTDVAARGLDIKNVSHIYNYDSPKTSEEYIHRVGRTARAGKEGKAITLLSERDYENFSRVLRDSVLKIEKISLPEFKEVFFNMSELKVGGINRNRGRYFRVRENRGGRDGRRNAGRDFRGRENRGGRDGRRNAGRDFRGRENRGGRDGRQFTRGRTGGRGFGRRIFHRSGHQNTHLR